MLRRIKAIDHEILILNLLLLLCVGLLPFTTALMAAYLKESEGETLAAAIYAGSFLLMSVVFAAMNWTILFRKDHLLAGPIDAATAPDDHHPGSRRPASLSRRRDPRGPLSVCQPGDLRGGRRVLRAPLGERGRGDRGAGLAALGERRDDRLVHAVAVSAFGHGDVRAPTDRLAQRRVPLGSVRDDEEPAHESAESRSSSESPTAMHSSGA